MSRSVKINYATNILNVDLSLQGSTLLNLGSGVPSLIFPGQPNPNEPAGYTRFAEYDFTEPLIHGIEISNGFEIDGCAWKYDPAGHLTITTDDAAPFSPNKVLDVRFPIGLGDGIGPGNYKLWDTCNAVNNTEYSKMYMHTRIKLAGGADGSLSTWECHPILTKWLGFWGTGRNNSGGGPFEVIGSIIGKGVAGQADSSFNFQITQAFTASRNMPVNRNAPQLIQAGVWHDVEIVCEQGSGPGVADGILRLWLDEVLAMEYTDVIYFTTQWPSGFWGRHYDPTWGGQSGFGSKQREDHIYIDHEYISGVAA